MALFASSAAHTWRFYRIGGFDQVALCTGADLENLHTLDQKLWAALSCPVKGLELDEKTLALIDTDKDGRIRAPELLAAIAWAKPQLKDLALLLSGKAELTLSAFADTPEGRIARASAERILAWLGKADANVITLAEAADTAGLFAATTLNGDGLVTPASTDDAELAALIADLVAVYGGAPDRSGAPGVNVGHFETLLADASALLAWTEKSVSPEVLTLGAGTAAAAAAVAAVRAKVDDWFARVRVAAFDVRALAALNRAESDFAALGGKMLSASVEEIVAFPLAVVTPGANLPLLEGVNPAWADRLAALHRDAVTPLFGADVDRLSLERWNELKAKTDAFAVHAVAKPSSAVEKLGLEKLRAYLAAADRLRPALAALCAADAALAPEFDAIVKVERLLRYTRDFRALLNNYVNFLDFYSPDHQAIFQAGTLYLDTRATELCIEVSGPTPLAALSKMYIAYCDLKRSGLPLRKIAACFTNGDSDFLFVGRNGLFYDRQGRDWDATIIAIADNPISVRQAFFAPYKKFVRLIEEQVAKRAAAAEAESNAKLAAAADKTANVDKLAPAAAKPPEKKLDIGSVAAIGIAVGALGTFAATVAGYVTGVIKGGPLMIAAALLGVVLLISGPSMLIAWLKLRQRTIGPILEANGWAINGRVKINIPFGTKLTVIGKLPPGSHHELTDPYADKAAARQRRLLVVLGVLLIIGLGVAYILKTWPFAG